MRHPEPPDSASGGAVDLAVRLTVAAMLRTINRGPISSTDQCPRDEGRETPLGQQSSTFKTRVLQ